MKQLTVRDGKGAKDRYPVLAERVIAPFKEHLERVRLTHQHDDFTHVLRVGGSGMKSPLDSL